MAAVFTERFFIFIANPRTLYYPSSTRWPGGNCLDGVSRDRGVIRKLYGGCRSPFLLFRLIFFLALSQIAGDLVNRRFACQFIGRAILVIIDIQSFCDPLQYAQGPGRFSFGKEVDLEFEVVAPFQRLVNSGSGGSARRK